MGKLGDTGVESIRQAFEVNLFSHLEMVRLCLPLLRHTPHSVILGTTSGVVDYPYGGWSAYCASKAALNLSLQCLAHEEPEIAVLAVEPGLVRTAMSEQVRDAKDRVFNPEQAHQMTAYWEQAQDADTVGAVYARIAASTDDSLKSKFSGKVLSWKDPELAKHI